MMHNDMNGGTASFQYVDPVCCCDDDFMDIEHGPRFSTLFVHVC